ncbi:MAG: hypothetical protein U0930_21540 [Pirellulales bacterium]
MSETPKQQLLRTGIQLALLLLGLRILLSEPHGSTVGIFCESLKSRFFSLAVKTTLTGCTPSPSAISWQVLSHW